jgi:DNA-binding transcriptional MerR regulator
MNEITHTEKWTIKQVSEMMDVSTHTLRFWEKELGTVIVPMRTRGGQRRYAEEHLKTIEDVKNLKKQGLSLAEIKETLRRKKEAMSHSMSDAHVDSIADQIADLVRAKLQRFLHSQWTK